MGQIYNLNSQAVCQAVVNAAAQRELVNSVLTQPKDAIEKASTFPMVVSMTVANQRGNQRHIVRMYEMRQLADLTDFEDSLVGADEDILRCETFGPDAFRKMPIEKRGFYRAEYQTYLKWRAGDNFDPIRADEDLCNWVRPGRYVGD